MPFIFPFLRCLFATFGVLPSYILAFPLGISDSVPRERKLSGEYGKKLGRGVDRGGIAAGAKDHKNFSNIFLIFF